MGREIIYEKNKFMKKFMKRNWKYIFLLFIIIITIIWFYYKFDSEVKYKFDNWILETTTLLLAFVAIYLGIKHLEMKELIEDSKNLINIVKNQIGEQLGLETYIEKVCVLYEAANEREGKVKRVVTHVTQWRRSEIIDASLKKSKAKEIILFGNIINSNFIPGVLWRINVVNNANKIIAKQNKKPIKLFNLTSHIRLPAFAVAQLEDDYLGKYPTLYVANPKAAYGIYKLQEKIFGHEFPQNMVQYTELHNYFFDIIINSENELKDPLESIIFDFFYHEFEMIKTYVNNFSEFMDELFKRNFQSPKDNNNHTEDKNLLHEFLTELKEVKIISYDKDSCPRIIINRTDYMKTINDNLTKVKEGRFLFTSITNLE